MAGTLPARWPDWPVIWEMSIEVCGARSVYDTDALAAIRRDVLTVLTHHVASRQAAMAAWGKWVLRASNEP